MSILPQGLALTRTVDETSRGDIARRASELLALRWSDPLWDEERIAVTKRWSYGKDGPTKTRKSEGHVRLHPVLATQLKE